MLVLSRKVDESIIIADVVEVKVVQIRGDKVRLGVTAPKEISVHREEVQRKVDNQTEDGPAVSKPSV